MSELIAFNTLATSAQYQQHTEFWTATLGQIREDFELRQNWQSYALPYGASPEVSLEITGPAGEALAKLSQGKNLNALVVVLSALAHVLRRYSNASSLFVDTPRLAGDSPPTDQDCIPVLLATPTGGTVREYLNQVRESVQGSYTYQDFPLSPFAHKLLKRTPTTNVYVRFEELHESCAPRSHHDLVVRIRRGGGFRLSLRGDERVFTCHYLEHLGRHLRNCIAALAAVDAPLKSISMIDAEERRKFQHSTQRSPLQGTVLDPLMRQAQASAADIAVATHETTLTYGELDDRSSRLATLLQAEYGIGQGDPVGLIGDRSERWIIGILAILKAGGVYVPLDPDDPQERLRFMIEDAGVRALLMCSDFLHLLTDVASVPMFALDLQLDMLEPLTVPLTTRVGADDAAYIIYTSGPADRPKGVVLTHRGLLNMAHSHVEAFGLDPSDRFVQLCSPGFDSSILEILVTLLAGARLVLVRTQVLRDTPRLIEFLNTQGVTTLNAVPADVGALDWSALPTIKRVISAGDSARVSDAVKLSGTRTFHNSYGSSETTARVTHYVVDQQIKYGVRIPVGKPIRNTNIYLLDETRQCVPEGCIGEICIAGAPLARGYLHHDDLTAAAFIAHPFEPGERLCRTGDLGVWLPDGNLEFVGRQDGQPTRREGQIKVHDSLASQSDRGPDGLTAPRNDLEARLGRIWAELLGRDPIGVHEDLFELGADSILILQAVARAQQAGIRLTAQAHFVHSTLASLATIAAQTPSLRLSQEPVVGRTELSPIQRWFFERQVQDPHHYNQSFLLEVPATLEPRTLEAALATLLEHHDALRLAFRRTGDVWEASHAAAPLTTRVESTFLDNAASSDPEGLFESVATRLQESFDLSEPPLLRAHLFRFTAQRPSRLLLIAHHLVIDAVSWGILLEDLHAACDQLEAAQTAQLPDKTTSFRDWTQRLNTLEVIPGRDYWVAQAAKARPSFTDIPLGTMGSADSILLRLDESLTGLVLQNAQRPHHTQINDLLLTALWLAFRDWCELDELLVELEGHGREEIFEDLDVSRTIGWFTTHYPVLVSVAPSATSAEALRSVTERLREIPARGLGYGLVALREQIPAPVRFNYLGQVDRMLPSGTGWKPLLGRVGIEHSPRNRRSHLFEIDGMVFEGCLQLTWTYNRDAYERVAIERLTQLYASHLRQLTDPETAGTRHLTPQDFPAARIDSAALTALLAKVQR